MKVTIITPTYNRPALVKRLSEYVGRQPIATSHYILNSDAPGSIIPVLNKAFSRLCGESDVSIFLSDYCMPRPEFVESVLHTFADKLHGLDGVVGIPMHNYPGAKPCCFFAVGRRYLERHAEHGLLCPEYWHFYFDTELHEASVAAGKYAEAEVGIDVDHPNLGSRSVDKAHAHSRSQKGHDDSTYLMRQHKGMVWGRNGDFRTLGRKLPWT